MVLWNIKTLLFNCTFIVSNNFTWWLLDNCYDYWQWLSRVNIIVLCITHLMLLVICTYSIENILHSLNLFKTSIICFSFSMVKFLPCWNSTLCGGSIQYFSKLYDISIWGKYGSTQKLTSIVLMFYMYHVMGM